MDRWMFNYLTANGDVDAVEQSPGTVISPNLDRICNEGVVFPNHHVVSPACTPTRYAVLTGRYGSRATNGAYTNYDGLTYPYFNMEIQPANLTLPKLLQQSGYRTGFTGKDHVHEALNFSQAASDTDFAKLQANAAHVEASIRACGFDYAENIYHKNPSDYPGGLQVHNMDYIAKGGIDFLEEWSTSFSEQPFFLYFSTTLTHAPNDNPRAWSADRTATPEGYLTFDSPLLEDDGVTWTRDTLVSRYASLGINVNAGGNERFSHLTWLDDALGCLMDKLVELGVDDNTIIFFFNDHGVEFGGKAGLYEHGSKSISIAWRKNGFPMIGHDSPALLSNVDFAPTILDYAGVTPPLGLLDGKSYRPILEGHADEIRDSVFIEFGCARGVIMDGFKYITIRWPDALSDPIASNLGWASLKNMGTSGLEFNVKTNFPNYYDEDQLYDLSYRISKTHPKGGTVMED